MPFFTYDLKSSYVTVGYIINTDKTNCFNHGTKDTTVIGCMLIFKFIFESPPNGLEE